ncbi:hypothetical protein ACJMK2_003053 [Sinanodonta woodiana]|uniref:TGF-beta family profile domain-containing protein n=1 Tax=Sinanodonta woodiana TaxID=1069815 RepID=A0ABD3XYY2_SINWO
MNTLRFPAWMVFLRLLYIINVYKVDSAATTHNKHIVNGKEIQDNAKKDIFASLDMNTDQKPTEVSAKEMTGSMLILDNKKNIGSDNSNQTSYFDSGEHPSAVQSISMQDISKNNGTDAIVDFITNVRMSAPDVQEDKHCRRLPLTINFSEIQMLWVNQPQEYEAYYCEGECSHPLVGENATNHAQFQSRLHFYKPNLVRDPCCVPTELSDLEIVYYVGKDAKRETIQGMVVEKCGCR